MSPLGKKLLLKPGMKVALVGMEPTGFEGVRLVSLDDTWSAMMFRQR